MRLYHDAERTSQANHFAATDEEDCYGAAGLRRGIWLTTSPLAGPGSVSIDVVASRVEEFEVTADGDEHRTFVVPHGEIEDVAVRPARSSPAPAQRA